MFGPLRTLTELVGKSGKINKVTNYIMRKDQNENIDTEKTLRENNELRALNHAQEEENEALKAQLVERDSTIEDFKLEIYELQLLFHRKENIIGKEKEGDQLMKRLLIKNIKLRESCEELLNMMSSSKLKDKESPETGISSSSSSSSTSRKDVNILIGEINLLLRSNGMEFNPDLFNGETEEDWIKLKEVILVKQSQLESALKQCKFQLDLSLQLTTTPTPPQLSSNLFKAHIDTSHSHFDTLKEKYEDLISGGEEFKRALHNLECEEEEKIKERVGIGRISDISNSSLFTHPPRKDSPLIGRLGTLDLDENFDDEIEKMEWGNELIVDKGKKGMEDIEDIKREINKNIFGSPPMTSDPLVHQMAASMPPEPPKPFKGEDSSKRGEQLGAKRLTIHFGEDIVGGEEENILLLKNSGNRGKKKTEEIKFEMVNDVDGWNDLSLSLGDHKPDTGESPLVTHPTNQHANITNTKHMEGWEPDISLS